MIDFPVLDSGSTSYTFLIMSHLNWSTFNLAIRKAQKIVMTELKPPIADRISGIVLTVLYIVCSCSSS